MPDGLGPGDCLLTSGQVAAMFRVYRGTVARWADRGLITTWSRTPGGHRRFRKSEAVALLRRGSP
jgi:excisionase family DNA binding protein